MAPLAFPYHSPPHLSDEKIEDHKSRNMDNPVEHEELRGLFSSQASRKAKGLLTPKAVRDYQFILLEVTEYLII